MHCDSDILGLGLRLAKTPSLNTQLYFKRILVPIGQPGQYVLKIYGILLKYATFEGGFLHVGKTNQNIKFLYFVKDSRPRNKIVEPQLLPKNERTNLFFLS